MPAAASPVISRSPAPVGVWRSRTWRILPPSESVTVWPTPAGGLLRGVGIIDGVEGHVVQSLAQDLGQHRGVVHRAARGRVVAMVQQHDGALFDAGGAGDRGLQRVGAVDPVARVAQARSSSSSRSCSACAGLASVQTTALRPASRMSACGKPTNTDAASAWPWVSSSMQRACSDRLARHGCPGAARAAAWAGCPRPSPDGSRP